MATKVSEQLLLAKSFIDTPEKWCRGDLHTDQAAFNEGEYQVGAHCTIGALQCAYIDNDWIRERLFNAMLRALPTHDYVRNVLSAQAAAAAEMEDAQAAATDDGETWDSSLSDFWNPDYEDRIITFNDYMGVTETDLTTHEQVMQMFDAAIIDAVAEELRLGTPEDHK